MFNFKCTSLCNFALSSSRLGQYIFAVVTGNDRLGMTEYDITLIASSASYIHEIGVWSWDKSFELVRVTLL